MKKKWFDIKAEALKRKTDQRTNKQTGGREGASDLSAQDQSNTTIIGNIHIININITLHNTFIHFI